jgi:ABC-type lipoprotein release transport system permease subunit
MTTVAADPRVKDARVRIVGQAMFASGAKSVGGTFLAIDPTVEGPDANLFIRSHSGGKMFESGDGNGAYVGAEMAKRLRLKLGRKLVYTTSDKDGEIVSDVVRVRGFFRTGVVEVDAGTVLLPIGRVRGVVGYGPRGGTSVELILHDQRDVEDVTHDLAESVVPMGAVVLPWSKASPDMAGLIAIDRGMNRFFQFFVGLLIAAGIFNTILMSVLERQREFGVMIALGMRPSRLVGMVLVEAAFIALLGLVLGGLITIPWYIYLDTVGIDLTSLMGEGYNVGGVLVDPVLRLLLRAEHIAMILGGVFSLTLIAGLYPALKAGSVPPVESIRLV